MGQKPWPQDDNPASDDALFSDPVTRGQVTELRGCGVGECTRKTMTSKNIGGGSRLKTSREPMFIAPEPLLIDSTQDNYPSCNGS